MFDRSRVDSEVNNTSLVAPTNSPPRLEACRAYADHERLLQGVDVGGRRDSPWR